MTLIKSISGFRGTIGGKTAENLTPLDIVKFAAAYGQWILAQNAKAKVVVGRDARISGSMVSQLVVQTLLAQGIEVLDVGLSTTPTVEMMVPEWQAQGGIILTASHNPKQWNALKLLNSQGEFISAKQGQEIIDSAEKEDFHFAEVDHLGKYTYREDAIEIHLNKINQLALVDKEAIAKRKYKIVVDAVNSTGGISVPKLLKEYNCEVIEMYCAPNGEFPHNPEPLPEHLTEISKRVLAENADLGIVVDPDVDRLALIANDGSLFGEEYTLVAVADYVLSKTPGNTVSNLSSSRALKDVTEKYNQKYYAAAVGEVNVVEKMKEVNAVIGGEGNGGIIYPELHYGRDALVGIALFLSLLAEKNESVVDLRKTYPSYFMSKNKIELTQDITPDSLLQKVAEKYQSEKISTIDGVKIDFPEHWVHLRKSNTEPIIRIYTEAKTQEEAHKVAQFFIEELKHLSAV